MIECIKFQVNRELYYKLMYIAEPCNTKKWIGERTFVKLDKIKQIYKAPILLDVANKRDFYWLKINKVGLNNNEKDILYSITLDLIKSNAPLLFPILYFDYTCENEQILILQPAEISLGEYISQIEILSLDWWVQVLYQIFKAVYYLEEKYINHNNITLDTILLQKSSIHHDELIIMLFDFSVASNKQKTFILGKDLNNFINILTNFKFKNNIFPKKLFQELSQFTKMDKIQTSGKYLSRWIVEQYPTVSDRCNIKAMEKLYAVSIGSILGEKINNDILYCSVKSFAIINTILLDGNRVICSNITNELKQQDDASFTQLGDSLAIRAYNEIARDYTQIRDELPILARDKDIMSFTQIGEGLALRARDRDIMSFTQIGEGLRDSMSFTQIGEGLRDSMSFTQIGEGLALRARDRDSMSLMAICWPISILYSNDHVQNVIDYTVKLATSIETNIDNDTIYSAVFIACLTHYLINGTEINKSIKSCIEIVQDKISKELYEILINCKYKKYSELSIEKGAVNSTMSVVLWSILNTTSIKESVISAFNVYGDNSLNTSITCSIVCSLSCLIYGFNSIPKEWTDTIDIIAVIKDKIAKLTRC